MVKTYRSRTRTILLTLAAATAAAGTSSCGGGSGTGASPATGLAFSVTWEQAAAAGASSSSEPALFASPIPPSVSAIRFILRPSLGGDCCIAVVRGSEAFENRHIQLADVQPGDGSLEVNGYPEDFAPNDGALPICATRIAGEGEPCEPTSSPPLPSFGSDEIPIDVVPGVTNVINVDVHSLPFLLDLSPEDGETADSTRPHVNFTVVDAVHDIDPEIDILISDSDVDVQSEILKTTECVDNSPDFPDCSEGGALDVRGFIVESRSPDDLPPGEADLRIRASNTAEPPRSMESNTTFIVPGEETTTTTVTSTSTTTIESTTTTSLPLEETFCLTFSVTNAVDLVGISYNVGYGTNGGNFAGSGENVECTTLVTANPEGELLASFNDQEVSHVLSTAIVSSDTFTGPVALARCEFIQVPPLVLSSFSIQVTEATSPDLSPTSATVAVEETPCPD